MVVRAHSPTLQDPVVPIEPVQHLAPEAVALGARLFVDRRLSGDDTVACIDCHSMQHGAGDGVGVASLPTRRRGEVNSPTLFNVAYDYVFNWTGKFDGLEEQIDGNITNPLTMASSWPRVVEKLSSDRELSNAFTAIYPSGLSPDSVRDALVTYELSLVTPDSRFDRFLRGEAGALTVYERAGYELFKGYGCISCHQGANLGGNMLERLGVLRDYFAAHGPDDTADLGRFNVTGLERDRYVFRVPTLRNVALTAPYFHDGSAATLEDAVDIMGEYQLGRRIEPGDVDLIVQFLGTLTGRYSEPRP
jgi:cytochrome c peroxidase